MFTSLLRNSNYIPPPPVPVGPWTGCWSDEGIQVEYGFGGGPVTFSGNVISVGVNGPCGSYDYATVQAGIAAAGSGDMVLIYPGVYTFNTTIDINNDIIIRGMSDDPADIHINYYFLTENNQAHFAFKIEGNGINVIFENFELHGNGAVYDNLFDITLWKGNSSTKAYFNKLYIHGGPDVPGGSISFGGSWPEYNLNGGSYPQYLGSLYATNISIYDNSGYTWGYEIGDCELVSATKYDSDGWSNPSADPPNPNDWVDNNGTPGSVEGYGYHPAGDHLVKFLI